MVVAGSALLALLMRRVRILRVRPQLGLVDCPAITQRARLPGQLAVRGLPRRTTRPYPPTPEWAPPPRPEVRVLVFSREDEMRRMRGPDAAIDGPGAATPRCVIL